jgi:hypothetical protein
MKLRRISSLAAGAAVIAGALLAPTAAFAAVSPDQTAPPGGGGDCLTKPTVTDDQPWYASNYTHSTIKKNPCSLKVRAIAYCTAGDTAHGAAVTAVGSYSTATCPDETDPGVDSYAHQVYYSGAWHTA